MPEGLDTAGLNLDANYLIVSVLWSAVGTGLWIYGKKQRHAPALFGGVAMFVVPFFIYSALWLSVASIAIIVGIYFWAKNAD